MFADVVALSSDGRWAALAPAWVPHSASSVPIAIFTLSERGWVQQSLFDIPIDPDELVLARPALAFDALGQRLVVGMQGADVETIAGTHRVASGRVLVLNRESGHWLVETSLPRGTSFRFGRQLAVDGEGRTVVVDTEDGAIRVFMRAETTWTEHPSIRVSASTGHGMSLSADGTRLITGADHLWIREDDRWSEALQLHASAAVMCGSGTHAFAARQASQWLHWVIEATATTPSIALDAHTPTSQDEAARIGIGGILACSEDGSVLAMSRRLPAATATRAIWVFRWNGTRWSIDR